MDLSLPSCLALYMHLSALLIMTSEEIFSSGVAGQKPAIPKLVVMQISIP